MGKLDLVFYIERETKGTYRFKEVSQDGLERVGTLYIKKFAVKELENGELPKKLKVVITPL